MAELACTQTVWSGGVEHGVVVPGDYVGGNVITADLKVWMSNVTPPPPGDEPTSPTNLTATNITGTSFTLTWDASETTIDLPILEYDVYQDGALIDTVTSDAAVVVDPVMDAVASQLSVPVTGLAAGTIYRYTITALNAAGQSMLSAELLVQTVSQPPPSTAPDAPTALNASSVADVSVTLSWPAATLPVSAPAVQGYRVYASGTTLMKSTGPSTLSTTVGGLFPSTSYDFTVRAYNSVGESGPSPVRTITTLDTTPPPDPNKLIPYGSTTTLESAITAAGTVAAVATAIAPLATYYGFTFSFKTTATSSSTGAGWTALTSGDLAGVKAMAKYYVQELAKYPEGIVADSALNQVVLAKTVTLNGASQTSFVLQQSIYQALPATATTDDGTTRRVLHQDFWRVVDAAFPAIKDGQESVWRAANTTGWLYIDEGGTTRANGTDGHPLTFVDTTAEQNYAEDRARTHGALMAQPRYSSLLTWMTNDSALTTKVNLIKQESTQLNSYMSGAYWDNINPPIASNSTPNAPTGVTITNVGDTVATVTWVASTLPSGATAVQGYRVYDASNQARLASVGASALTVQVTGLVAGTSYSVYVRAFNSVGESPSSTTKTFTTTGGQPPPPPGKYFTASSIWNKPLPANAPVLSNSAALLQTLANDNPSPWYKVSMDKYGMPTYYTKSTDPIFHVQISKGCPPLFGPNGPGIKLPAGRHGNAEGAMTIIDTTSWTNNGQQGGGWVAAMHMAAGANWTGSTYQADGGAVFYIASNGLDGKLAQSDDKRNTGSLRGCPNTVRRSFAKEDYAAGGIYHAIEGFINDTGNTFVFPWVGTESGSLPGWPEGTQMRLKASVNLNAVGPTGSAAWMLAKCCQEYGVFAGDQAGATAQLKAENTLLQNGGGNDWAGTNLSVDCLKPFPFNSTFWEVIQYGYTR